jgi:integrase
MMLTTCYGCGLRVSELVALKVRDIDGERHLLRIEQGKGAKDRQVILSPSLLEQLRCYWRRYRPAPWLFTRRNMDVALNISTPQRVFTVAKRQAGIDKVGGIHGLRHNAEFRIIPSSKQKQGGSRHLMYIELGIIRDYSGRPIADRQAGNVPLASLRASSLPRPFL